MNHIMNGKQKNISKLFLPAIMLLFLSSCRSEKNSHDPMPAATTDNENMAIFLLGNLKKKRYHLSYV